MADYRISGERLTAYADQVRRLAFINGGLTPEMMLELLEGMDSSWTMPKAESFVFGEVEAETENEYGLTSIGTKKGPWTTYSGGYKFTPNENISVLGIRTWSGETSTDTRWPDAAGIWDENGNLLASCTILPSTNGRSKLFDSPINLSAGKNYIVSVSSSKLMYLQSGQFTVNPCITYITGLSVDDSSHTTPIFPTYNRPGSVMGIADIIIAPPQNPVPAQYSVQLETMTDIANEVMRITGGTNQMTTAQMITGLSGVELLEDYEEVTF